MVLFTGYVKISVQFFLIGSVEWSTYSVLLFVYVFICQICLIVNSISISIFFLSVDVYCSLFLPLVCTLNIILLVSMYLFAIYYWF
jgi:hypothetical protein